MKKKLPKMFVNEIERSAGNNKSVFSSSNEIIKQNDVDVKKIINDIFSSSNYVYKADVEIKIDGKTETKKIVGRNNNYLITMEGELIPISKIESIKKIP